MNFRTKSGFTLLAIIIIVLGFAYLQYTMNMGGFRQGRRFMQAVGILVIGFGLIIRTWSKK